MTGWPVLETGEEVLRDPEELWLRQVHPQRWKGTLPSALSFRQSSSDKGKISGARESKQSAAGAFDHHTRVLQKKSEGTWGVSVAEIEEAGARAIDDSGIFSETPGHAYVDYRPLTKDEEKIIAGLLAVAAEERARLFPSL